MRGIVIFFYYFVLMCYARFLTCYDHGPKNKSIRSGRTRPDFR